MQVIDFNNSWSFTNHGSGETKTVTTPHDAMLAEGRNGDNPSGSAGAYFAGGAYTYEKAFDVPAEWEGKHIVFRFEGIYQTAKIYINDTKAGEVWYGYTVTDVTADSFLNYGGDNRIRVEVDNTAQPNSRWYSGAGIYRPVSLYVLEKERIELDGVQIDTLSICPARIRVQTACTDGACEITILDGEKAVAKGTGNDAVLEIADAKLWDADSPSLYTCRVELQKDGTVVDCREQAFGIRKLEWSPKGFFVNGKEVKLRGGCIHHDNGILGACGYEEAEKRRVRILKENGFNAIRSAHNPCTSSMLDACDELGMYMMDESWDMWYRHKSKEDYAAYFMEHYKEDLIAMVRKDYNHPSVIMYSIGNEVSEPAEADGQKLEQEMTELLHKLDPSRAVTGGFNLMIIANAAKGKQMYDGEGGLNTDAAAPEDAQQGSGMPDMSQMNSTMFNQMAQQIGSGMNHSADSDEADAAITPGMDILDIAGYNYGSGRYPLDGEKHSERILLGSETFPQDICINWEMVKKYPYLVGDFMWTAWDYLGEAGIGAWTDRPEAMAFNKPYPWLLGGAGVISILGDPDGEALYAKTVWGLEKGPKLAVRPVTMPDEKTIKSVWRGTNAFPAWSYRGHEGEQAIIEVYGNGESAELFLNGNSIGKKKLEQYKAVFETVYQAGTVRAVLYDEAGNVTGEDVLSSAEGTIGIRIEPEGEAMKGKLLFVNIDLAGENGVIERACDEKISVTVTGGTLLGYGSATACTEESYLDGSFHTCYGRSLAVIRVEADKLTIHADGEGKTAGLQLAAI